MYREGCRVACVAMGSERKEGEMKRKVFKQILSFVVILKWVLNLFIKQMFENTGFLNTFSKIANVCEPSHSKMRD